MFSIPYEEVYTEYIMHTNSKALESGHNELDSATVTTAPIVPTAIIAAVNGDRVDHILGDNGQMATQCTQLQTTLSLTLAQPQQNKISLT